MCYIFHNGSIFGAPNAEALLVEGAQIRHIGTLSECKILASQSPQLIDITGYMLLPAFSDAHTHFVEYAKSRILVNLDACDTLADVQDYLQRYKQALKWEPAWVLGGGWAPDWADAFNRHFLDKLWPDTPVALFSRDYHAKCCNTKALEIAGIRADTPDPEGGFISRDAHGAPTGLLYESATLLLEDYLKEPPDAMIISAIKDSVQDMYRYGLVGFHTMERADSVALLRAAQKQGSLFRFAWWFLAEDWDIVSAQREYHTASTDFYQLGGLKLFADGTLGSRTAAMLQPYPNSQDNKGILRYGDSELYRLVERAALAGYPLSIHAIGDAAIRQVIDAAEAYNKRNKAELKLRIEHLQVIDPKDLPRLKANGIAVSMQPLHIAGDIPLLNEYGLDTEGIYCFRTLIDLGISLCFGSDAPIVSLNPFWGIYSATQRKAGLNPENPVFQAQQCLSAKEAIRCYCQGGFGKWADLMVLKDYRSLPAEYWLEAQSLLTMVNGEIVHNAL